MTIFLEYMNKAILNRYIDPNHFSYLQFQGESLDTQNDEATQQFPRYVMFETEAAKGVPIAEAMAADNSERFQMVLLLYSCFYLLESQNLNQKPKPELSSENFGHILCSQFPAI